MSLRETLEGLHAKQASGKPLSGDDLSKLFEAIFETPQRRPERPARDREAEMKRIEAFSEKSRAEGFDSFKKTPLARLAIKAMTGSGGVDPEQFNAILAAAFDHGFSSGTGAVLADFIGKIR